MKRAILLLLVAGFCFATGAYLVSRHQTARHDQELALLQAAWEQERLQLEAELERAKTQAAPLPLPASSPEKVEPAIAAQASPAELIARLRSLAEANRPSVRLAVHWLEELREAGPAAVPAIREFLATGEEIAFELSALSNRPGRDGRLPGDFVLPPTLRLGLFDVLRRIGGDEAEQLLADTLARATSGLEVACLTRALHELASNRHRDTAVSVAQGLLNSQAPANSSTPLTRYHRDYLFAVLTFCGDTSFVSHAQNQLVGSDSQIDRAALRYLQRSLGPQAVAVVAQVYENPLLQNNAAAKEPLARLALNFVGADARANEFYQKAINDPVLTRGHRKNLIEDLNEDGFADPRNLTSQDLSLIQNRIALIEQLAPKAMDKANAEAFQEAYKDLVNMRTKLAAVSNKP